jgi:hypothetical protein
MIASTSSKRMSVERYLTVQSLSQEAYDSFNGSMEPRTDLMMESAEHVVREVLKERAF